MAKDSFRDSSRDSFRDSFRDFEDAFGFDFATDDFGSDGFDLESLEVFLTNVVFFDWG